MTQPQQAPDFTPEELSLLGKAAVLAGATVAVAKYSGAGGTRDEFRGIIEGLEQATGRYPANPLVQALLTQETRAEVDNLARQFQGEPPTQRAFEDLRLSALNRCSQAAELLASKAAPEQAVEVKAAIVEMCEQVAQRSKEGGVLGFGGARVDVSETAAVEHVKRALGL